MARIFLIAGTGVLGNSLLDCINLEDNDVYVSSRRDLSDAYGVSYVKLDSGNYQELEKFIDWFRPDVIIDFLVHDTENFGLFIQKILGKCKHYIFLSSYRVYAESDTDLCEDSSRLLDLPNIEITQEYAFKKAMQEDLIMSSSFKNWTILRPGITFGRGRLQLFNYEWVDILSCIKRDRPLAVTNDLLSKYSSLTPAMFFGESVSKLLLNKSAYGEIFNVMANDPLTWSNVARVYSKITGLKIFTVDERDYLSLGFNPWQYRFDRNIHRKLDGSKLRRLTGLSKYVLEDCLSKTLKEETKGPSRKYLTNSRRQGRLDFLSRSAFGKHGFKYMLGYIPVTNHLYNQLFNKNRYTK